MLDGCVVSPRKCRFLLTALDLLRANDLVCAKGPSRFVEVATEPTEEGLVGLEHGQDNNQALMERPLEGNGFIFSGEATLFLCLVDSSVQALAPQLPFVEVMRLRQVRDNVREVNYDFTLSAN